MNTRAGKKGEQEDPDQEACSSVDPGAWTQPCPGTEAEGAAKGTLKELAGLVKSLIQSQAVRDQEMEKESSRQERRWKCVQHQFSQIQQQVNIMRDDHGQECDMQYQGQPQEETGDDDDEDDDDPGEAISQMSQ
ncbi:Retrovirus-related Pol polyprotein from transposon 17.6, partial [Scomber scombrus]